MPEKIPGAKEDKEQWKPIPGFEGLYEVSTCGRVRTVRRQGSRGGILKQTTLHGYRMLALCKDGKYTRMGAHRAVALAFIENPNGLPFVNHKDENKTNNNADNLEWCTCTYNNNYGTARQRSSETKYRTCIGVWPDGTVRKYDSCTIAAKETGISQGNIWGACNGLWKRAGGVEWRYEDQQNQGGKDEKRAV